MKNKWSCTKLIGGGGLGGGQKSYTRTDPKIDRRGARGVQKSFTRTDPSDYESYYQCRIVTKKITGFPAVKKFVMLNKLSVQRMFSGNYAFK